MMDGRVHHSCDLEKVQAKSFLLVGADGGKDADPFDKLRAGSSTASFAQCANDSVEDDRVWGSGWKTDNDLSRSLRGDEQKNRQRREQPQFFG
jgi:hypothetical protein